MSAVPSMHEDMHQKTGWQQQKRQNGKGMGLMLGQQIKPCDCEKRDQDDFATGPTGATTAGNMCAVVHPAFFLLASLMASRDRLVPIMNADNASPSLICINVGGFSSWRAGRQALLEGPPASKPLLQTISTGAKPPPGVRKLVVWP